MSIISFQDENSLLDAIRCEAMPNGNLSIRGVARLANINDRSVISGADFGSNKLAEKLVPYGFEGADLTKNGFPPQAVILVLEYFAFESKAKSRQARALMQTFGTIGLMRTLRLINEPEKIEPQIQTPKTYIEALKALVASEEAKELLRVENEQLEEENKQLSEAVDELFEFSSIIRVAKFNNCEEKLFHWRKLKAASTLLKAEIKSVPCPRFGKKNLYSHEAWRYCYPEISLPETTTLKIFAG